MSKIFRTRLPDGVRYKTRNITILVPTGGHQTNARPSWGDFFAPMTRDDAARILRSERAHNRFNLEEIK